MKNDSSMIDESDMSQARGRVGMQPFYIQSKSFNEEMVLDHSDQGDHLTSSIKSLPKFASKKIEPDRTNVYQQFQRKMLDKVLKQHYQKHPTYVAKQQHSNANSLLLFIVWVSYALGSSQASQEVNIFSLFDFLGVGIATILTFYNIIINKKAVEFHHFLHIMSAVTTVVIFSYQPSPNDNFIVFMRFLRSFRLFFILNMRLAFQDLAKLYFRKFQQAAKVILPWLFIVLVFTIIMCQGNSYQFYNRCTLVAGNKITANITSDFLCGAKQCQNSQFTCSNPLTYDQTPDHQVYDNLPSVYFGFFQYKDFLRSFFAVISTSFLSNSAKIIDLFSTSAPMALIVIINMALIILSISFLSPLFIVLIKQSFKDMLASTQMKPLQPNGPKVALNHLSGGEFNSLIAPTFGINSHRSIDTNFKPTQSNEKPSEFKVSQDQIELNLSSPQPNIKTIPTPRIVKDSDKQKTSCSSIFFQYLIMAFVILVGGAHLGLNIAFVFGNLTEISKRLVGVCLIVIFIVWSFWILIKLSGITEDQQKGNDLNFNLIFSFEIFIYCVHLADYVCRIFLGKYLLEDSSPVTALATSLLLLRLTYIPIAFENLIFSSEKWIRINLQVKIYKSIVNDIIPFALFIICCSLVLSTLTMQVNGEGLFNETIKYMKIITNLNWVEHYNHSSVQSSLDNSYDWGIVIKSILILVGELFLLKLIYSDAIIKAYSAAIGINIEASMLEQQQSLSNEQISNIIRIQKTFFIISYQFLGIRSSLRSLSMSNNYQSAKNKTLVIYVLAHFIGYCLLQDVAFYSYVMIIGDFVLLFDEFITIISNRFWGKGSFVNGKWYNLVNLIVTILAIITFLHPFFNASFIRVFRAFLLMQLYPQMKQAYNQILESISSMKKLTIFSIFICISLIFMVAIMFSNTSHRSSSHVVVATLNYSLRLLSAGFDLSNTMKFDKNMLICSIYPFVIYFLVVVPLKSMFIGNVLANLEKSKNQREQKQILKEAQPADSKNESTMRQNYQKRFIKQKILSLTPKYNSVSQLQENYLLKLLKEHQNICNTLGATILFFDATLGISVPVFSQHLTQQQAFQLKLSRFFFFMLSILVFSFESFVFKACNNHFYSKLIIISLSFPGAIIGFIPLHKVEGSQQLINILQFFMMLSPLPLLQIYFVMQKRIGKIIRYVFSKFNNTIWISLWITVMVSLLAGILSAIVEKPFIYCFSLVFIGFCGSTYENTIEKDGEMNNLVCFVQIIISLAGFIMRSVLIATFVFETVDKIHERKLYSEQAIVRREDFQAIFQQEEFIDLWNELDVKSNGLLPFRVVINKIFKFAKCFKLYRHYIQFLFRRKSQAYMLKIELFRKLNLPIRSLVSIDKDTKSKSSEYVISIYDLVAGFLCLALQQNVHQYDKQEKIDEKSESCTGINWHSRLGFDSTQWNEQTIAHINNFNYKIHIEEETQERFSLSKHKQTSSSLLVSALSVFPRLRRKILSIKEKAK